MVLLIRGNVVQSLTQYNAVPDGNVALPGLSFAHAPATGVSRTAEGNVVVSVGGTAAMEVSTVGITADAFIGNGAAISNIVAANIDGLSQALDVIDASSVSSNVFVGDAAGLSNIAAANVTGLTAALDVIDASSVTANTVTTSNLTAVSNEITVTGHLRPDTNVTWDLGSAERKWRDLYLSSGTLFLGNTSVTESGGILQLPIVSIQEASITGNISAAKFVGDGSGLTGIKIPPSINTVTITDDSWNPIDDLALSTTSIGYLVIEGNNFEVGTTVSVGGTPAASISVVNSSELRVTVNPLATGTYDVVVQTGGGGNSTKVNGVSFDPLPVWSTGSSLGNVIYGNAFSITLAASDGGSNITYSATTSLPPSTTLASNGVLQGNITGNTSTTYNFTVEATDAQLQSALRGFSLAYLLLDGSTSAQAAASASDIKAITGTTTDGVYWILHNGSPMQVYCDMNFDGGGWMMVTKNTANSWGWDVWGSTSDLEYTSNNTDFYSNMRRNRSYTAVMFKWTGNQVSYNASGSNLKDASGTYSRRTGTFLPRSDYSLLGTYDANYLYQKLGNPSSGHRGCIFSNYNINSYNQGGFMEYIGLYPVTSQFWKNTSDPVGFAEIYIR